MTGAAADDGLTPAQRAARAQAEADLALPQAKAFLDMISAAEGTRAHGYNTAYGGGRIDDLSPFPGVGKNTASGRYQITAATFSDAQEALGLDDFGPQSRDLAAAWLLHRDAILPYLKIGDFAGALDPASRVWSSLPKGEGSWNAGRHDNRRHGFQKAHDFADVQALCRMPWRADSRLALARGLVVVCLASIWLWAGAWAETARSGFDRKPSAVKADISRRFKCSWEPHLDGGEQCGEERLVTNWSRGRKIESVELTCPIRIPGRESATMLAACRSEARWLMDMMLPGSIPGRDWIAQVFRAPLERNHSMSRRIGKVTVLAQSEGPEDADIMDIVIGVTRGDPQAWDLPRP